ncbi:MAG: polymer-forming cytoskeletal protein [Candidatus Acidiferrales bacterium]
MWRKPDAKPSSDTPSTPNPMPARTQPQSAVEPQQPRFERPSPVPPRTPAVESVSPGASRVSAGIKIRGEISGNSDLYLDGEASGKIRVTGARVTVGPEGKVQADIEAREIVINGNVQGNLKADATLRLGSSSRVQGALTAPSIGIDDGARFRGKVEVTRSKSTPAAFEPEAADDAELLRPVAAHSKGE